MQFGYLQIGQRYAILSM